MRRPDFLVVGHVTKDLLDGGYTLGGTATYSALTAKGLGLRVAVVTAAGPDIDLGSIFQGIDLVCLPSPTTTTFRNLYRGEERTQFLYAHATPLRPEAVPLPWRTAPIVHLGPVAQEMGEEIIGLFPRSLLGLTPQGWLRGWDEEGRIHPLKWEGAPVALPEVDVLILSEEDLAGEAGALRSHLKVPGMVVITRGAKGATLYYRGGEDRLPAPPAQLVDPTGAGDIFAATFLVRFAETDDPYQALRSANVAASLSVEREGLRGVPTREEVERRAGY